MKSRGEDTAFSIDDGGGVEIYSIAGAVIASSSSSSDSDSSHHFQQCVYKLSLLTLLSLVTADQSTPVRPATPSTTTSQTSLRPNPAWWSRRQAGYWQNCVG